jgi:hypothetical protein
LEAYVSPGDHVLLSKATQQLLIAYNSHSGSEFCKIFAAKLVPELSPDERALRQQLLQMLGQMIDPEFEQAMDKLVAAWIDYRKSQVK